MTKSTDHREGRSGTEAKNDVAETVARQTKRMANAAGEEAAALAAKQKSRVQDYLADFSSALKEGGQSLENSGHDASAYFVNQLASELEAATMEEGRSPAELLQEVEQFARRRPAVFFGAALLAGFGAMRFIKSADAARSR